MPVIYKAKGRAKEYCDLALNIYTGCTFGCTYCYAPLVARMKRKEFHKQAVPRKKILLQVAKEAPKHKGQKVLLSFMSDPYPYVEEKNLLTRDILKILCHSGVRPVILTKNPLVIRDLDIIEKAKGWIGTTLTSLYDHVLEKWEPNAPSTVARTFILFEAHRRGIKTWVSLEPVLDVESALELISFTHKHVDLYKVGMLTYNLHAKNINWPRFRERVEEQLQKYKKQYIIKKDLMEAK